MKKNHFLKSSLYFIFLIGIIISFSISYAGSASSLYNTATVRTYNNRLYLNGKSFLVKSVCYEPVDTGKYYNGMDWEDESIYQRDFPKIIDMGFNTIRTYHNSTSRTLFRQAAMHGLKVCPTFIIEGTIDFSDEDTRNAVKGQFRKFILSIKDEPALLFWIIGNEQNYTNGDSQYWYSLANELAGIGRSLEGFYYHPYAISEGGAQERLHIGNPEYGADDESVPKINLWACNVYQGDSLNEFFIDYTSRTSKPLFISEYGTDRWDSSSNPYYPENGQENQEMQRDTDIAIWQDIFSWGVPVIGGSVFSYSDNWWKDIQGTTDKHDFGGYKADGLYDGFYNEEWWGLMKMTQDNQLEETLATNGYKEAQKIYVSPSVAPYSRSDGTIDHPYGSIHTAVAEAQSGDVIQLLPGIHYLTRTVTIDKHLTFIGNINNPHSVYIKERSTDRSAKHTFIITNNSHVSFLGISIEGIYPFFVGNSYLYQYQYNIKQDISRLVLRNCRVIYGRGIIKVSVIISNSNTQLWITDNIFKPYPRQSCELAVCDYSAVHHRNNNRFNYYTRGMSTIREIFPSPALIASSDTIIHRNGNYEDITLNISWEGLELEEGVEYSLFYILVNIPQGQASAYKNDMEWYGETIPVTTSNGSITVSETLSVHNWNNLLWVVELKDSDGNTFRAYTFEPETILDFSIDTVLQRNNSPITLNFNCAWNHLDEIDGYTLHYFLKGPLSGTEEAAINTETNAPFNESEVLSGPISRYSSGHSIRIPIHEELVFVVQLKDADNTLIDESHIIPRTILSQNVRRFLMSGVRKIYYPVYATNGRIDTIEGGYEYLLSPESEYNLFYILIENDTGNGWSASWDHLAGSEWTGTGFDIEGIHLFNPIIIKKDLTVYDYANFLWISELRDDTGQLIDMVVTPASSPE